MLCPVYSAPAVVKSVFVKVTREAGRNTLERLIMEKRRHFLAFAGLLAAGAGTSIARAAEAFEASDPAMPPKSWLDSDAERYWAVLRRQWLLAPDRVNLNCGMLGCTPLPVLRAMMGHLLSSESFREEDLPRFGFEENRILQQVRTSLAEFVGCSREELALTRNTTEGNAIIANGLDLKPGDEALLTDQEHHSARGSWEIRAARCGVVVKNAALPKPPRSVEEIVAGIEAQITPRTRILVISHITTSTGLVLPVKEICAMARRRGILTQVDGAHAIGQVPINIREIGCDFYAASPHKWLMAPKGCGMLYIREEHLEKLWPLIGTNHWQDKSLKAYRFSNFGTANLSVMAGLQAALDFFKEIGAERIYARSHSLATRVRDHVSRHLQLQHENASSDAFYGNMVSFRAEATLYDRILRECKARNVRITPFDSARRVRVSTHIFTQPTELNLLFDALSAALA